MKIILKIFSLAYQKKLLLIYYVRLGELLPITCFFPKKASEYKRNVTVSPEQLKTLQHLSQLFESGLAGSKQVKQLSELLAEINQLSDNPTEDFEKLFL